MLHILLLVLKILLWILLGILGLVLFVVLLVLFAPIHYRASVKYDGKALVKGAVRFLFVSFRIEFSQEEKKLSKQLRIFGFRIGGRAEKSKNKDETEAEIKKTDVAETPAVVKNTEPPDKPSELSEPLKTIELPELTEPSEPTESSEPIEPSETTEPLETIEQDESDNDEETNDEINEEINEETDGEEITKETEPDKEKKSIIERLKSLVEKLKNIWIKLSPESIMDTLDEKSNEINKKYKKLEKKLNRYKKLWNLKCTVKTRKYLKKYLPSLAKHIGPRRIKGYVHYGFGDPAKTGQITGYISLLPFVYQKGFSLRPDFYEKVIEADVNIKGYFMLGYILRIALKPYIWQTVKVARKVAAQNK